jgi:hypothetical protein
MLLIRPDPTMLLVEPRTKISLSAATRRAPGWPPKFAAVETLAEATRRTEIAGTYQRGSKRTGWLRFIEFLPFDVFFDLAPL